MNRFAAICVIVVACLLVVLPVQAQDPTPAPPSFILYVVTVPTANLRAGPSTDTAVVGTASEGIGLLVYDEAPATDGWLRVFRQGQRDAFIADFLVERAPNANTSAFYPIDQEPLLEVSGRGELATDAYEIPEGAYRIDATINDQSFALRVLTVQGECEDGIVFNEVNLDASQLTVSGLFVSEGCSVVFETGNVDGEWELAVRDIIGDYDFLTDNMLIIASGTVIRGAGRALTMPTTLTSGTWSIAAEIDDHSFILWPQVLGGECTNSEVFNALNLKVEALELSSVYQSPYPGCIIYWETGNVQGEWALTFTRLK